MAQAELIGAGGKEWRRCWNTGDEQRFGRVKRAAMAMETDQVRYSSKEEMLKDYDKIFLECGGNLSSFVKQLQEMGKIEKRSRRSRRSSAADTSDHNKNDSGGPTLPTAV